MKTTRECNCLKGIEYQQKQHAQHVEFSKGERIRGTQIEILPQLGGACQSFYHEACEFYNCTCSCHSQKTQAIEIDQLPEYAVANGQEKESYFWDRLKINELVRAVNLLSKSLHERS